MPTLPRDYHDSLLSPLKFAISGRLLVTRFFQQLLGEFSLGRFITYSGDIRTPILRFDELWETILDAYITFTGLPLILSYAGPTIYAYPQLKRYFEKFSLARRYFSTQESTNWQTHEIGSWKTYRDAVLEALPFLESIYNLFNPRESLTNTERYKHCQFLTYKEITQLNPYDFACEQAEKLKNTTQENVLFWGRKDLARVANPFISLEVGIICSFIFARDIYYKIGEKQEFKEIVQPYLKFQSARIRDFKTLDIKQRFNERGEVQFAIPFNMVKLRRLELDTYGLRTKIDLPSPKPGEPYLTLRTPQVAHVVPTRRPKPMRLWVHKPNIARVKLQPALTPPIIPKTVSPITLTCSLILAITILKEIALAIAPSLIVSVEVPKPEIIMRVTAKKPPHLSAKPKLTVLASK